MLLQSLLLIATLAIIGSALLTSTLVSAKSSFHALVVRQSRNAMTDATTSFMSWAQNNVKQNGIDQIPVWAATPSIIGPYPACAEARPRVGNDVSAGCKFYRTISWSVTGYTGVDISRTSNNPTSEANNLATAQNERRLSATLTVAITNSAGSVTYARQSHELTVRVFHASPYVTITAERDSTSEGGSIASAEGDTAGYIAQQNHLIIAKKPDLAFPASNTNTLLLTTVNCTNTPNNSLADARLDDNQVIFAPARPFGNLAWAYEVPCKPLQQINPATAPSGYKTPSNSVYGSTTTANTSWQKNDENTSSFAR